MITGHPYPDQDLRLDELKVESALENDVIPTTTAVPELRRFTNQGSEPDRTRLMQDILTSYNKGVNPDNVKLDFGVNLIDFRVVNKKLFRLLMSNFTFEKIAVHK